MATDIELVRRWRRGDGPSFLTLMQRYTPALAAVAMSVLHDRSLVDDALQETYLRARTALDRLQASENAGSFLAGITRNVCHEIRRKQERERGERSGEVVDARTPTLAAGREELRTQLRKAVDALPDDQREIFLMKYTSGMRYSEIAHVLNMSEAAVSQKLWRIRRTLQAGLKEFHE